MGKIREVDSVNRGALKKDYLKTIATCTACDAHHCSGEGHRCVSYLFMLCSLWAILPEGGQSFLTAVLFLFHFIGLMADGSETELRQLIRKKDENE